MPHQTPLQQAVTEALQAAAAAVAAETAGPTFAPTPDGYYARPDVPDAEVTEALAEAHTRLNSRTL